MFNLLILNSQIYYKKKKESFKKTKEQCDAMDNNKQRLATYLEN